MYKNIYLLHMYGQSYVQLYGLQRNYLQDGEHYQRKFWRLDNWITTYKLSSFNYYIK